MFFIAGCVLWEICQLELTAPIKAGCFCVCCNVLESKTALQTTPFKELYLGTGKEREGGAVVWHRWTT